MRKIYLLLVLALLLSSSVRAQIVPDKLDSITQSLNQQFPGGHPYALWRVERVRQQLEEAVLDQQMRRIPLLLDYLTRTVPDTVTTVQPREAMSLLLAAGAYGLLLQRVLADKSAQAQQRYRQAPVARPNTLADIADFYTATHVETLTAQTLALTQEKARFIQLLLDAMPRGGVSPDMDAEMQQFRQQYPSSPYNDVLKSFQTQEEVKVNLRAWHIRQEAEQVARSRQEWGASSTVPSVDQLHFDGEANGGTGYFTGSLGHAFQFRYNLGLGIEFALSRYLISLRTNYGPVAVQEAFTYEGVTYPAGNNTSYSMPEVSLGYCVVNRKRVTFAPYVGAAVGEFSLPEQPGAANGRNGKVHVYLNRPLTTGFIFSFLPGEPNTKKLNWVLKIRGGVRAAAMSSRPDVNGGMFYLSAGVGYRVY